MKPLINTFLMNGKCKRSLKAHAFLVFLSLLFSLCIKAQPGNKTTITGIVTNEINEALAGVTVSIKGTNTRTATDSSGRFIITAVNNRLILQFSNVSSEPHELTVEGATNIHVRLKPRVTFMADVRVEANTGYQTARPNEINGSLVVIDNKTLNLQVGTNILRRLDGVTSGLIFDNNKLISGQIRTDNITIRGLSTINASTAPLIVLDNYIYEGNINNINPDDIESITVLKDASAASIWGARAGNGVIVITSKKARLNQKTRISVNAGLIIGEKPDLYYLPGISSPDYIDLEQYLFNQGYFDNSINTPYYPLTPAVEIFLKAKNGIINSIDSAQQVERLKRTDSRTDFNKYVYKNSITQQYSVNLQGGSSNNAWNFSIGHNRILSELGNRADKINLKIDNIYKPAKWLFVNIGSYYTKSNNTSGKPGYNAIKIGDRQVPYLDLFDNNGAPLPVDMAYRSSFTDTAGEGKLLNWKYVPFEDYKHSLAKTNLQELFSYIGLQFKMSNNISLNIRYQFQKQDLSTDQLNDPESFSTRNILNLFSILDRSTGTVTYQVPPGGILSQYNSTGISQTARAQLDIKRVWASNNFSALIGSEIREAKVNTNSNIVYGYNPDPLSYSIVDFINYFPTFIDGNYSAIPSNLSFSNNTNRFISLFANASYLFKQRYSLSGSIRRDGSNIFGAGTNDRWKPLWSAGAGWNISEESFYTSRVVKYLRMRTTYGYSGNVDLNKTSEAVAIYLSGAPGTNLPYTRIRALNNPDLRWEKTRMINFGLDFILFRNIFSGSVDYYLKRGTDLYGPTAYDYTAWGATPYITKNVAGIKETGMDLVLNSNILDRIFKWNVNLLFNYNRNKTVRYESGEAKTIASKLGSGNLIIPVIGKPLYGIAAYKWAGLDNNGNPQGYVDGVKSIDYDAIFQEGLEKGVEGNIVFVGSSSPVISGSLTNNLSWKKLSVSFNISYKLGYYFQKPVLTYSSLINSGTGTKDYVKRWQNPGDENSTDVPSLSFPVDNKRERFYLFSEVNVLKADHIRLNFINLSYNISEGVNTTGTFKEIQVYLNASDPCIIWKANKEGYDPEYLSSLKPIRSLAVGLRVTL